MANNLTRVEVLENIIRGLERELDIKKRRIKKLEYVVHLDELTGVLNRRALDKQLEDRLSDVKRYNASDEFTQGLLFIDLDGFKAVNDHDQGGHSAGDEVLRNVASNLSSMLRKSDVLARFGGDEFVIISRARNIHELELLAERVRVTVYNTVTQYAGLSWQVAASIGATFLKTDDSVKGVLSRADNGTYAAKEEKNKGGTEGGWRLV